MQRCLYQDSKRWRVEQRVDESPGILNLQRPLEHGSMSDDAEELVEDRPCHKPAFAVDSPGINGLASIVVLIELVDGGIYKDIGVGDEHAQSRSITRYSSSRLLTSTRARPHLNAGSGRILVVVLFCDNPLRRNSMTTAETVAPLAAACRFRSRKRESGTLMVVFICKTIHALSATRCV